MIILSDFTRNVGETVLGIHFRTDPEVHAEHVPDPLEPIKPGEAMALFGQTVLHDEETNDEWDYPPPRLSALHESSVIFPCEIEGTEGFLFTHHHADRDWAVRNFSAMGYDSTLAEMYLSRYPPELREFIPRDAGAVVEAKTSTTNGIQMHGSVRLETEDVDHPWPADYTVFGRRKVRDESIDSPTPLLVNDITTETYERAERHTIWRGEADLTLGERGFGDLQPTEVLGGYVWDITLQFEGMEALWEGSLSEQ